MTDEWNKISDAEFLFFSNKLLKLMEETFEEAVNETLTWLEAESTKKFFYEQQERLSSFYESSGIREKWDKLIHERATRGADLTEEVYAYARNLNREADLVRYTNVERSVLNKLADSNYELIKNVSEDQIRGIRQHLVQDYFEGVHPTSTSLKQALNELKLEPIRGFSPEKRAEMIARTEIRRTINVATLEDFKSKGVEFVEPDCSPGACAECEAESEKVWPIDEALDKPSFHPNCNCGWKPARNPETGLYQKV